MRFHTILPTIILSRSLVAAQAVSDDAINFSTIEVFPDLKKCLKAVFILDYTVNNGPVQRRIGCDTNDCICRPDTLEQAAITAGSMALSQCSNSNDKLSATSVLVDYCAEKGFTAAAVTPTDDADVSNGDSGNATPKSNSVVVQTSVRNIVSTVSGSETTIFSTVTSATTQTAGSDIQSDEPKQNLAGPIAGGVVGGVALLAGIGFLIFWLRRRKQNGSYVAAEQADPPMNSHSHEYPPYVGGIDNKMVGGIQETNYRA